MMTINPYVQNRRYKSYAVVTKKWDTDIMKLATHIDSISLMTSTDNIEELPWSLERMFTVLSLSDDVAQKAAMVRAFSR